jgi:hypothetical protein
MRAYNQRLFNIRRFRRPSDKNAKAFLINDQCFIRLVEIFEQFMFVQNQNKMLRDKW